MRQPTCAQDELEVRVAERTAALTDANENLQEEIDERRKTEEKLRCRDAYLAEAQAMSHTGSWAFNTSLAKRPTGPRRSSASLH